MFLWRGRGKKTEQAATSVIDQGCEISGRLVFVGTFILDGRFQGEIVSSDTLVVAANAEFEGNAQVGTAIIHGQVKGNVAARERVELQASARVVGDIESPVLVLEEGVAFDGRCKMTGREAEKEKAAEGQVLHMDRSLVRLHNRG